MKDCLCTNRALLGRMIRDEIARLNREERTPAPGHAIDARRYRSSNPCEKDAVERVSRMLDDPAQQGGSAAPAEPFRNGGVTAAPDWRARFARRPWPTGRADAPVLVTRVALPAVSTSDPFAAQRRRVLEMLRETPGAPSVHIHARLVLEASDTGNGARAPSLSTVRRWINAFDLYGHDGLGLSRRYARIRRG